MQPGPRCLVVLYVLSVGLGFEVLGCTPPQAVRPPSTQGQGAVSRKELYDKYRLEYHSRFPHSEWTRSDGDFTLRELANVLDAYPESREAESLIQAGDAVGVGMAVTSGALLGYALFDDGLANSTRRTLYIASGSVFVGALVVQLLWPVQPKDITDVYNRALYRDLMGSSADLGRPIPKPRQNPRMFAVGAIPIPVCEAGPIRGFVGTAIWVF